MVRVLVIRNAKDVVHATQALSRIRKKLPQMTSDSMMAWGKILERNMRNSAMLAKIQSNTGELFGEKGIQWRQRPRGKIGKLWIKLYGIYLDSMVSHYVAVTRRRTRLLAWAAQARSLTIRRKAGLIQRGELNSFGIYVRKHEFIRRGYKRARKNLNPLLKRAAQRAIK